MSNKLITISGGTIGHQSQGDVTVITHRDQIVRYAHENLVTAVLQDVVWENIVNCTAVGSTLTKTGGVNDVWDAGATSVRFATGDCYVNFETDLNTTHKMCGLSIGNIDEDQTDIDFAIYLQATGHWQVYESGTQVFNEPILFYASSDTFRVQRVGSVITYERDTGSGFSTFYTSLVSSSGDLLIDTSIASLTTPSELLNVSFYAAV